MKTTILVGHINVIIDTLLMSTRIADSGNEIFHYDKEVRTAIAQHFQDMLNEMEINIETVDTAE